VSSKASSNPHRPSTGRRDRWREELTPFAPCSRLRGAECLSGFCAATGEMDECPRHRERRESVALRGPEQLVKRCVGRAPANADQYAEGGIEDAAALHVEREVGRCLTSALRTNRRHAIASSTELFRHQRPTGCARCCSSTSTTSRRSTTRWATRPVMICCSPPRSVCYVPWPPTTWWVVSRR
jgi:hypothetical protein